MAISPFGVNKFLILPVSIYNMKGTAVHLALPQRVSCAWLLVGLYELWKTGRYKSYPPNVLVDLVARILALVPPWTRVYRVQR